MNLMMNGLSKILKRLQSMYFSLVATISEFLYMCRQAIDRLISIVLSVGQSVASTWRDAHSILIAMYSDAYQTLSSLTIFGRTWNLIKLFGNLVRTIILTGFTFLTFMVVLIARGLSALVETIKTKLITK